MQNRYAISLATVVMLVLLRLNIGWHFYSEGTKHYTEPGWSSEGFLRAAKGPLAPTFQSVLPGDYGFRQQFAGGGELPKGFGDQVINHWEGYLGTFTARFGLTEKPAEQAAAIVHRRQDQLRGWLEEVREDMDKHLAERKRLHEAQAQDSANEVPYQKKRIADKITALDAEVKGWLAQIKGIEDKMVHDLDQLLADQAIKSDGPLPAVNGGTLQTVDKVMTYGIMGIGVCLILGLFTRTASVLGALFLLNVVLTQPFWVSDTQPTFNQFVEMFALLTLATTHVGRWGGLDFFIHHQFGRRTDTAKG